MLNEKYLRPGTSQSGSRKTSIRRSTYLPKKILAKEMMEHYLNNVFKKVSVTRTGEKKSTTDSKKNRTKSTLAFLWYSISYLLDKYWILFWKLSNLRIQSLLEGLLPWGFLFFKPKRISWYITSKIYKQEFDRKHIIKKHMHLKSKAKTISHSKFFKRPTAEEMNQVQYF